jgi:hypothetical protein
MDSDFTRADEEFRRQHDGIIGERILGLPKG